MLSIPNPADVVRALPHLGWDLILPALTIGAVQGSMVDILLGHEGWPMAKVGLVLGPLCFALAINALHRREAERTGDWELDAEAYRRRETAKRKTAAIARGELIELNEHRGTRR